MAEAKDLESREYDDSRVSDPAERLTTNENGEALR